METTAFHEGLLTPEITLAYHPAIFNTAEYRALYPSGEWVSFYLLDKKKKTALAGVHFHLEASSARTPFRAPFGSFEFDLRLSPRLLYRFIQDVEARLLQKGVVEIILVNAPRAYDPAASSLLETFLINQQYSVRTAEVASVLHVSQKPFTELIRSSERSRSRQGGDAGLTFQRHSRQAFLEIFRFLTGCHQQKDYNLSISEDDLQRGLDAFPDDYLFFSVNHQDTIVAAAISIRVRDNVLYNFMVNHLPEFNHLSPPVLLMEGIYAYCAEHSISLMDMGTSAWAGEPKFSLLDFKLRVGGEPSAKLSFHKKVA